MREHLGLDEPLWQQYLDYLGKLLQGDFGTSIINNRPIARGVLPSGSRRRSSSRSPR